MRYARETGTAVSPQGTDLALGFIHRALLSLADGRYGLRGVELPHEPAAALPVYEEFFGAPVKIRRPEARLRVPRSLLAKPLSGSNESMRRLALAFLAQQVPGSTAEVTPRVHAALAQGLGTANSDISSVARLLAIHPRTLQRRLAAEGTTFAAVLDEVRRDAAWRYLTATDLPMNQIAGLLGLSEQSALTRCCRRWWQQSPQPYERAAAI